MDLKKVVEKLKEYGRWKGVMYINENGSENYIPVSKAIEIVNSAAEPQWIPCSERLPNFSLIINTNDKKRNICNGCFGAANNDCNLCNRHN